MAERVAFPSFYFPTRFMNSFAATEVRRFNGVPTIFVDGEPLHGMTATSVKFSDPTVVRGFVEGGVEIMMIWIEIAIKCWRGPGQYDWSYAEEKLRFFEEHSGDTKWLIRVRLGLMAPWWGHANPDEVHAVSQTLTTAVIHSPLWLGDVSQVVREFVSWLQTTRWAPRIIGFMLNAGSSEEWLAFDTEKMFQGQYHPVIEREFRVWLREQYLHEKALQAAWRDEKASFDLAKPPTGQLRKGSHIWGLYTLRDPYYDRPAIDYYRFLNERLADALISLCKVAKGASVAPIICGGFHSYLWWETGIYSYIQEYGHTLVQKLNASPYVDFISDITSYDDRYPGGPSGYLGLAACQNLSNTLHYTEVDLGTHLNMTPQQSQLWENSDKNVVPGSCEPILPDRDWKWKLAHCGRDEEEQIAVLEREAAHNLITGTPYWWFDIKGHSYASPGLTGTLKRLSLMGKEAVKWDRSSLAEVAFVCSEETPLFQSAMNGSLLRFEMEGAHGLLLDGCTKKWGLAGVPFDCYELHDLAHPDFPGEQYKLLIFVNCAKVSEKAAQGIKRWQNGGRTLLWTFAAACLDEDHFDPALGEGLVGIRLGCQKKRRVIHVEMGDNGSELTRGGAALNFGAGTSVGPVFYADDSGAQVLGTLREGGEAGFVFKEHDDWNALYLSMISFGPQLLRNMAKFAGAHIWCESDDVIYANRSMLCLHSASSGNKRIQLPRVTTLTDLQSGVTQKDVSVVEFEMPAYRTRIWRMEGRD